MGIFLNMSQISFSSEMTLFVLVVGQHFVDHSHLSCIGDLVFSRA